MNGEVNLLHAGKHEKLLQIDTMFLMGMVKHLRCLKKEVRDEVDFLYADKHQTGLQVHSTTLDTKVSNKVILSLLMGGIKVLKITSLQIFAISQKS